MKIHNNSMPALNVFDLRFVNVSALIVKVTNQCNLNCLYCYENISKKGENLPLEIFKKIAHKALASSINQKIQIIFHGGEPTVLPVSWYQLATDYAREIAAEYSKEVCFSLQTNFVSISGEKISALQNLDIRICASIDAFDSNSLSQRPFPLKAVSNINRAKDLGVHVNILSTINKSNYNLYKEFIDYLNRELNIRSFKANVAYPVGQGRFATPITPEEIFQAKKDILFGMINNQEKGIYEVNLLKQLQKYFAMREDCSGELCDQQTCGAGKTVLGFNHYGDILPCGRFSWDDSSSYLGHINSDTDTDTFSSSLEKFQNKNQENWIHCNGCAARKICNYGCQAFIVRSNAKINLECESTKMVYNFVSEKEEIFSILTRNFKNMVTTGYGDSYSDYSDN